MKNEKVIQTYNDDSLECKTINYLRKVIGEKYEKEGLSKEVLTLSCYLDKYIVGMQNQQKERVNV
jgi:hypothetical protein